jgi:hypothetical protein
MATSFDDVHGFVRPILGDVNSQNYRYAQSTLDAWLRLAIITEDKAGIQENGTSRTFTEDVSNKDQAILAYSVARGIISGTPDFFQYRTPVMTVARKGASQQMISHIDRQLGDLRGVGGFLALQEDNEIKASLNWYDRFWRDWEEADSEVVL